MGITRCGWRLKSQENTVNFIDSTGVRYTDKNKIEILLYDVVVERLDTLDVAWLEFNIEVMLDRLRVNVGESLNVTSRKDGVGTVYTHSPDKAHQALVAQINIGLKMSNQRAEVIFNSLEKGFYKVKSDGEWTVMYWSGEDFYTTTDGQYSSCDHRKFIEEVGDKIDLPEKSRDLRQEIYDDIITEDEDE